MLIDREKLIKHLNRIYCNGQIGELVLQPDFGARAITVDQTLLVVAPELEGVEPLSAEVGVMDLKLLIRSLDGLGSDDPQVSLEFTGNRILIKIDCRDIYFSPSQNIDNSNCLNFLKTRR